MKLIFLFLCVLIGGVYEIIPYDSMPLKMFLFSPIELPFKTWLYFLMEHGILIMLSYIIASEAKQYKVACKVFFLHSNI